MEEILNNSELYKHEISTYKIYALTVHKFYMPLIASNMFILISNGQALIVDPHESEAARQLLIDEKVNQAIIILTHEHFDHISGVNFVRGIVPCTVYGNEKCKEMVKDPAKNMSAFFMSMMIDRTREEQKLAIELFPTDYKCVVDKGFEGSCKIQFEDKEIELIETPGHSPGSICAKLGGRYIFTGDSLVGGNKVITRLPGGSRKEYNEVTRLFLERLPEEIIVFPGHGIEGLKSEFELG